ncbi:hypothetical protein BKA62DRAFT_724722 [Auriculariales sp. MPI-PUGE-AT-0066]|nr:hypothetical protein BKA62DRAFT_724722 [Auriculariales sp. MPI-PUGE-AT-0066]
MSSRAVAGHYLPSRPIHELFQLPSSMDRPPSTVAPVANASNRRGRKHTTPKPVAATGWFSSPKQEHLNVLEGFDNELVSPPPGRDRSPVKPPKAASSPVKERADVLHTHADIGHRAESLPRRAPGIAKRPVQREEDVESDSDSSVQLIEHVYESPFNWVDCNGCFRDFHPNDLIEYSRLLCSHCNLVERQQHDNRKAAYKAREASPTKGAASITSRVTPQRSAALKTGANAVSRPQINPDAVHSLLHSYGYNPSVEAVRGFLSAGASRRREEELVIQINALQHKLRLVSTELELANLKVINAEVVSQDNARLLEELTEMRHERQNAATAAANLRTHLAQVTTALADSTAFVDSFVFATQM